MTGPERTRCEERVLVLAPTAGDATLSRTLLTEAGFACHVCADLAGLCRDLPGGHIWLTAGRQGSDAVVTVKDTGVGIPAEKLPRLFEMFFQVDRSLERSQGGLGIGLSLVRRLVEMHGGSVRAKSEGVGKGSEFTVRLPVLVETPNPGPPQQVNGEVKVAAPRRRILVVDDNRDAADSLAMLLRLSGNEVHTAHDGLEAVEAAARLRPDVVLLDIGMPKLNGYDACRRIREQPVGKDMVLVALTGWGQEEDRRRSQEAGFNGHLVKPVDPAALEKLLTQVCATSTDSARGAGGGRISSKPKET